jgi:hypothetical protein
MLTGRCFCGRIRFSASGAPRVHFCHCGMCRRASGGPFATLVWLPEDAVLWQLRPKLRRSSAIAQRGFCARCGTPLCLKYDESAEVAILLGAFDQADQLVPTYHYGIEARLSWVDIGRGLPEQITEEQFAV